jgi:hypothetical protein
MILLLLKMSNRRSFGEDGRHSQPPIRERFRADSVRRALLRNKSGRARFPDIHATWIQATGTRCQQA